MRFAIGELIWAGALLLYAVEVASTAGTPPKIVRPHASAFERGQISTNIQAQAGSAAKSLAVGSAERRSASVLSRPGQ